MLFFINPEIYTWVILPILMFLALIYDVSMETICVIYIARGIKYLAPIIAFFEIVIWLLAKRSRDEGSFLLSQTFWHLPLGLQGTLSDS